jgi:hypothetical protein
LEQWKSTYFPKINTSFTYDNRFEEEEEEEEEE